MKKSLKFLIPIALIIIIILSIFHINSKDEIKAVSTQSKLNKLYNSTTNSSYDMPLFLKLICLPWNIFSGSSYYGASYSNGMKYTDTVATATKSTGAIFNDVLESATSTSADSASVSSFGFSKDYSTTNIQVENVDEADVNKTDGDYIYSISDNYVLITDVRNPEEINIASKISPSGIPEDLILYNNKLVVISASSDTSYYSSNSTYVDIYNIDNKINPLKIKGYQLLEPYYTSRCINNRLYVISSGYLRKENNDVVSYYYEDNNKKDLNLKNMYYLKDVSTNVQTLISTVDLNDPYSNIGLQSYLMDISNAYVSQNNIYLLNNGYNRSYYNEEMPIYKLFSWRGAIGSVTHYYNNYSNNSNNNYKTNVYKFNINLDGSVSYDIKTTVEGQTINQFSLDEYNNNLRIALTDREGSRIVVLDDKLKQIGESSWLAKGEKMYSSRFMGSRAYLVTYRTVDPLYVIDLSNPSKPIVLGELKIPGYSTYLHPYDENHLIGIGMETKENVYRNSSGKVTSTTATIVGMKMALFDVSNVNNPIQISSAVIGDSRTTSSILTNHKALLFSKEKELIAIPVNNYPENFEISTSSDDYSSIVNSYTGYHKQQYTAEGYLVYKINLIDGINLKGTVTHELQTPRYWYNSSSRLLRGLYIDNNLFTISEDKIKVNNLDNLELVSELNLRNIDNKNNLITTSSSTNSPVSLNSNEILVD